MEEVDRIIVHSLRQIGCEIEDGISSLKQFTTEMVIEATAQCLNLVVPGLEINHHLPPSMTARFRVGSTLAQACSDLGYPGDVGYQTFLYWGETDIRRILMFLIEKLPKEAEKSHDQPLGANALLERKIAAEVRDRLRAPWLPPKFALKDVRWADNFSETTLFKSTVVVAPSKELSEKIPKELQSYYTHYLKPVNFQVICHNNLSSSLIEANTESVVVAQELEQEWNQKGLPHGLAQQEYRLEKKRKIQQRLRGFVAQDVQKATVSSQSSFSANALSVEDSANSLSKDSRFTLTEKLVFTKEANKGRERGISNLGTALGESKEELLKRHREEESKLQEKIDVLNSKLLEIQVEVKKSDGGIQQLQEQILLQEHKNEELQEVYGIKKKTFDLLPNADENLIKLQSLVESTAQRLVNLSSQWEKHRAPLIEQYRHLRELNANRVSETQRKLEEIRHLRERMKEIAGDVRAKEELHVQLLAEYEKMTRDVNRSAYTRRILEIVSNIKKQKQDIDKVLIDTKDVQKEINQLSGKLDRTFIVTDELVFKDAKKDEAVRKAYKYLAALHENCSHLVKTVEETGAIMREIRDLEDQIENESQKKVLANLERITADYKQMKQENATLIAKLKDRQEN